MCLLHHCKVKVMSRFNFFFSPIVARITFCTWVAEKPPLVEAAECCFYIQIFMEEKH